MRIRQKQAELALLLGMAAAVFCAGFCGFAQDYKDITDTVFRLHILANSDSDADQQLKLKVRDAVLENCSCIFEGAESAEEAAEAARSHMTEIQRTAERVIAENGADYPVRCEVTEMEFDKRIYDSITMPAGRYQALRLTIGSAEGKNWWCVMFPPLCLPAVTDTDEALEEFNGVFTEEELDMLSNAENYECRFYFLELYRKIKDKICA
ncbi:MAG: stage II sporulation protein R [Oscillospiraceae bacterium]|nr:stage II sporulation protein R [Oscillospiraceae bacterium]